MTMEQRKKRRTEIPFGFATTKGAEDACIAVRRKYEEKVSVRSTGLTLYVTEHTSLVLNFEIMQYVRSLGGIPVGCKA